MKTVVVIFYLLYINSWLLVVGSTILVSMFSLVDIFCLPKMLEAIFFYFLQVKYCTIHF
jgi:hypothetical protein